MAELFNVRAEALATFFGVAWRRPRPGTAQASVSCGAILAASYWPEAPADAVWRVCTSSRLISSHHDGKWVVLIDSTMNEHRQPERGAADGLFCAASLGVGVSSPRIEQCLRKKYFFINKFITFIFVVDVSSTFVNYID